MSTSLIIMILWYKETVDIHSLFNNINKRSDVLLTLSAKNEFEILTFQKGRRDSFQNSIDYSKECRTPSFHEIIKQQLIKLRISQVVIRMLSFVSATSTSTNATAVITDKNPKKKGWRPKRRVGGGSTSTSASGSSSSHAEPDDSRSATISN